MARTPQTARKSTGGIAPRRFLGVRAAGVHVRVAGWHPPGIDVWHPLLIAAADQGGRTRVFAGLAAKQERVGDACYRVNRNGDHRHPTSAAGGAAAAGADVVTSPFPATSSFGLLPYAAFRGHEEAVAFFCAAGFDPKGTGRVVTVHYSAAWAKKGLRLTGGLVGASYDAGTPRGLRDNVRASALQIACHKRDAGIVKLLRAVPGVPRAQPFLLDLIKPEPGSMLASQKGTWSPAFHPFCPPTFKAAAAELLRISRKHGGAVGPGGRLRWAFTPATLASLLLPALADDMSPWLDAPAEGEYRTSGRRQAAAAAALEAGQEVIVISSSDEEEEEEESEEEEEESEDEDE